MPNRRPPSTPGLSTGRDRERIILLRATLAAAVDFLEQIASANRDEGRVTAARLVEAAVERYRAVLNATEDPTMTGRPRTRDQSHRSGGPATREDSGR